MTPSSSSREPVARPEADRAEASDLEPAPDGRGRLDRWAPGVVATLGLLYPLLVWIGLARFEPRSVAFLVAGVALLRFALTGRRRWTAVLATLWRPALVIAAIVASVLVWNDPVGLLLMPTAISAGFLATFGASLRGPLPMVERFARLQVEDLRPEEIVYCRRVTWVWCGFFALNGSLAAALAIFSSIEWWALYTGMIAYVLTGALFAVEFVYRYWRFGREPGGWLGRAMRRLVPVTRDG